MIIIIILIIIITTEITIKIMIKVIMKIWKKLEKVIIKYLIVFKHLGKLSWFFCKGLMKGILKFASILTCLDEDLRLLLLLA